jgi:hypothetical protein
MLRRANNRVANIAMITNYGGHATADQALDEMVDRLVEALRARGSARPDSDFDLMIVLARPHASGAGRA